MRTRIYRYFPVLMALLLFGATEVYAQTGTVVTHSGQRFRGQIVSLGGYNTGYDNSGNYGNSRYRGSYGGRRRPDAGAVGSQYRRR